MDTKNSEEIDAIDMALFDEIDRLKKAGASFSQLTNKLNEIVADQRMVADKSVAITSDIELLLSKIDGCLQPVDEAIESLKKLSSGFTENLSEILPKIEQLTLSVSQNIVSVREQIKDVGANLQGLFSTGILDSETRVLGKISDISSECQKAGQEIRENIKQKLIEISYQVAEANGGLLAALGGLDTLCQESLKQQGNLDEKLDGRWAQITKDIQGLSHQISGANSNLAVSLGRLAALNQGVADRLQGLEARINKRVSDVAEGVTNKLGEKIGALANQLADAENSIQEQYAKIQTDFHSADLQIQEKVSSIENKLDEVSKSSKLVKLLTAICCAQVILILAMLFMK